MFAFEITCSLFLRYTHFTTYRYTGQVFQKNSHSFSLLYSFGLSFLCKIFPTVRLQSGRGCREIAIFPLFRTKRRIPWKSCDLSHLFPRGILLILFVLSLLYYFYAHKKNIRFLFYELFFMLFSHLFFLRIFSTFHEGIDDICLYFGQLHTA